MEFLKAHYEKIILSVVLVGLAAAAALMPMKVSQEKQKEEDRKMNLIRPKVSEMEPIVMTNSTEVLARLSKPARFQLAGEHNVFNPVRWQRMVDGGLIKGTDAGPQALVINEINPLFLKVEFRRVIGSGADIKYEIAVAQETEGPQFRSRLGEKGKKNNMYTIQEVRGDPDAPTELVVLLEGEREPITIGPNQPYERVIGYSATITYEPDKRTWKNLKQKDELIFGGETYNIVAITENEVVMSAKSNKKQSTIEYTAPRK